VNKILHVAGIAAGAVAVSIAAGAFALTPVPGARGAAHHARARGAALAARARAAARPGSLRPGQPMIPFRALANHNLAGDSGARRITRSVNWAGYAVTRSGKSFRLAQATFFVPYLNCKVSPGTYSADWVGFDGFLGAKPDSVEQDGIEADCLGQGGKTATYRAWYEMFPKPEVVSGIKVGAGDSITASVSYLSARYRFRLTVKDNTNGHRFAVTKACAAAHCPRTSAQVISEAPANNKGQLLPLADYGAVTFASIGITDGAGHHGGLGSRRWRASKIVQFGDASRKRIAQPTPVHASSFASYWVGSI
jgi:Peptidase A4 family